MNKKKAPWYIWLSILAWMFLLMETSIRMSLAKPKRKFRNARYDYSVLESSFGVNFFSSAFGIITIPLFTIIALVGFLVNHFPAFEIMLEIMPLLLLLYIYFSGVYVTYRLWKWRQEKIPHLL